MSEITKLKQHYHSEYHQFLMRSASVVERVAEFMPFINLKFLNIVELEIIKNLAVMNQLEIYYQKLVENQEQCEVIIYNQQLITKTEVEAIYHSQIYEIKYNQKFNLLAHPQILGTLLNNDVDKQEFGDIIINTDNQAYIISTPEAILDIEHKVTIINKTKVRYCPVDQIEGTRRLPLMRKLYCKSLRTDVVIKNICKIKRDQAGVIIAQGSVRINQQISQSLSKVIQLNDIISIRKHGKYQIKEINQKTKGFEIIVSEEI